MAKNEYTLDFKTLPCPFCGGNAVEFADGDIGCGNPLCEMMEMPSEAWNTRCCGNFEQCWEPCGDLGKSEEHAVAVDLPVFTRKADEDIARLQSQNKALVEALIECRDGGTWMGDGYVMSEKAGEMIDKALADFRGE